MQEVEINYSNAPIILAMIQFRFNEITDFNKEQIKLIAEKIKKKYPIINERFIQGIIVDDNKKQTSVSLDERKLDAIQVMSENRKEYFTIANNKFTFQSHEKYSDWNSFTEFVKVFWGLFSDYYKIDEMNGISLRYVNKFKLPLSTKDITKYFNTYLQDNENTHTIREFQFKYNSFDEVNGYNVIIGHALERPIEDYLPYIYDIDVISLQNIQNNKDVWSKFNEIRNKKNHIFNNGITEEAKKLIR
ncbi:MAG: TIGR04255 family protein [Flavobacteriaceae bacterium]